MKKIIYWSPHISNVATIKNVLNSAKSLKLYSKNPLDISILNVIGEWSPYEDQLRLYKIRLLNMGGLNLKTLLPITGFFKSRIIFFIIFFTKFFTLKKILKNEKPDFLIIHLLTLLPIILLFFFKFETKFILRISGLPRLTFLRKILWKIVSKKIFLVTCPSIQTKKDLDKLNIFPEHKLKILYDPILEIKTIHDALKKKNKNNFENKKYFLNIGRLTKQKNQILLIKAFSQLLDIDKDLYLIIAGEGEEKENLEKYIKKNKLDKNIHLAGHVKNIYPLINNSIAVISSSLWEDPGAVMIEASYCRKNVISSNCPNGPEEFFLNGKSGYLFKNNDKRDLLNKMKKFLFDSNSEKFNKILLCKKKTRNYTIFNHFKKLETLLNVFEQG